MIKKHKKYLTISAVVLTGILANTALHITHYHSFAQENAPTTSTATETNAAQYERNPESTALFPQTLLNWSFATDPNAIFNVSKVPLASRVNGPNVNPYQSQEAKLLSIAIVNRHTSGTPSQGGKNKEVYNFTNWQYVDTLVAWAGSAGEGIIVPPSGDITDVAHRNGVPVLGTVFFPPTAYGGKAEWVREFVQKDANGNYVMADKLLEMAEAYGFDGWFINQETHVDSQTASELKQLLIYLQQHKKPNQQIVWYDSMLTSGAISWQGALNNRNKMYFQDNDQRVADKMFLDFRWDGRTLTNSKALAQSLGRSPFELYAGLDVQARGINSSRKPRHILDENAQLKTSIGLYVPDWTLRDGGQYNLDSYWENEKKFWINESGDPRQVNQNSLNNSRTWLGISKYLVEKTPVTSLPFVTHFNVGNGTHSYQQGTLVQTGDFNNRSVQDILPTYRWIIDNGANNTLTASFSYQDAFNGGSSILLTGNTTQDVPSFIKLYASSLNLDNSTEAYVITKGAKKIDLVVTVENNPTPITLTSQQTTAVGENNWQKHDFSLAELANRKVTSIGLNVYGTNGNQQIYIGELGIGDFKTTQTVSPVSNVTVVGKTVHDDLTESVRLSWQTAHENTSGYNIYRHDENGITLVGTTSNTAFTLVEQKRGKQNPTYTVVPRDINHVEHLNQSASTTYQFEELKIPDISIQADKTFVRTDEVITLTAKTSPSTEKITWRIPDAEIISETDRSITVKFKKAGVYTVSAIAENSAGQSGDVKENYVSVYDNSSQVSVENLALLNGVTANGSGYTNPNETYRFAFDDALHTKWCDNQHEHPYMVVDLGGKKTITGFELHHAQAGGESAEWNTKDYDILVSDDGQNWQTVVEHRNNTNAVTNDSIAKIEARYVKLYIQKAESTGNTARIYEFKIFGVNKTDIEVVKNAELIAKLRDISYISKEIIDTLQDAYTPESLAALSHALDNAKPVFEQEQTPETIQQHFEAIQQALSKLVLKEDLPVYMTNGINVNLNENNSLATFTDNNNDTSVFVNVATEFLPHNIQSLVVEKRMASTINNVNNTLFDTYDIYFVDENGVEQPVDFPQTPKVENHSLSREVTTNNKLDIIIPIDKTKEVINVHLLTREGDELIKPLNWKIDDDNRVTITTESFRTIALEFKEIKPKDEEPTPSNSSNDATLQNDSSNGISESSLSSSNTQTSESSLSSSNTQTAISSLSSSSTQTSESSLSSSSTQTSESSLSSSSTQTATSSLSSSSTQSVQIRKDSSTQTELPQTGTSNGLFTILLGFVISIGSLFTIKRNHQK